MNDHKAEIGPVVVALPPEIDVTNSDAVYRDLMAVLTPGVHAVIADLTATSFCDSSGVHAIVRAHEEAAARQVALRVAVSPEGSVRRVLQLTGAVLVMPVHETVAEALSAA